MLPLSRKPEIIRLHQLEENQRKRYINQFSSTSQQWAPQSISSITPIIADIYYTFITICKCKRRLGEQYTYVAMYNPKHYEEQGVLVNENTRKAMFLLEILQRHLLSYLLKKLWSRLQEQVQKGKIKILRDFVSMGVDGLLLQGKLFMLMLFTLGWNKHFNLIDTLLRNQYVYTYKNKNNPKVDYRIQGYMILAVFVVKLIRFFIKCYQISKQKQKKTSKLQNQRSQVKKQEDINQSESQGELCRICYDKIKNKSSTSCGHIFCWTCILQYLMTTPICPVCRSNCSPKEVIQLQNY